MREARWFPLEAAPQAVSPSSLERVLALLGDGAWHARAELELEVHFADAWLRVLREKGYVVEEESNRNRNRIRLASAPRERKTG